MKKTYDWSVRLWITVSNSQRKIEVVASVHTNIHQLKIQISKILDLPILDTHMDVYFRSHQPLKATSTLFQNDITSNSHLSVSIVRTKQVVHLPIEGNKTSSNLFSSNNKKKDKENV